MVSILHLGKFSSRQLGGMETAIDILLRGLGPSFQILKLVANDNFSVSVLKQARYIEYSVPCIGTVARTPFCPTMPYQIKNLHERYRFSIVHLHLPNPMAHLASLVLPRSVKRIISWHSDVVRQKHLLKIYQPCLDRLLTQTEALIVATPYLAKASCQLAVARQRNIIRVIPYGIEFDYFLFDTYKEKIELLRKEFAHHFIVFSLGRHVYYKGFSYLIEAMAQLSCDIILLLGGDGPLTKDLKRQVKTLKLERKVYFLGEVPKEDLPAYYHICDVFCLPSIEQSEAFGIVQLEAMACTKPVISCSIIDEDSCINREGLTGFVVPPRDSRLLALAIERFYHNRLLSCYLGKSACTYVKDNFTHDKMVQRVKQLYEEIL